jgi:hypothetical protein
MNIKQEPKPFNLLSLAEYQRFCDMAKYMQKRGVNEDLNVEDFAKLLYERRMGRAIA